jgi:predicted amidohydrolase
MRVTVLELAATWGQPERVLDLVDAQITPTDLVLLPEASLTGYVSPTRDFDLTRFAEPVDGPTAQRCAAIASGHGVHLVAPLVLRDGGVYNAMACWDPRGALVFCYRKRHPWLPETWATPGDAPLPVLELCHRAVTIAICYDLHFIARDSADALEAADVLLFPSAWVERPDSRPARLSQLARRFGLHIANANWAPGVVNVPGQGDSCIVAPDGTIAFARHGHIEADL